MNGLFASSGADPLLAASNWVLGLVQGPLATSLAILAIAAIGALMLRGRVSVLHAGQVLLGCFLLFGAQALAASFRSLVEYGAGTAAAPTSQVPPQPQLDAEPTENAIYDPYAGAAVRYN